MGATNDDAVLCSKLNIYELLGEGYGGAGTGLTL